MPYRMAGIYVHKKILAVVVSDVEVDGQYPAVFFASTTVMNTEVIQLVPLYH